MFPLFKKKLETNLSSICYTFRCQVTSSISNRFKSQVILIQASLAANCIWQNFSLSWRWRANEMAINGRLWLTDEMQVLPPVPLLMFFPLLRTPSMPITVINEGEKNLQNLLHKFLPFFRWTLHLLLISTGVTPFEEAPLLLVRRTELN